MRRKRLLTIIGSVCLALMLALPLVASCGPATTEEPEPEVEVEVTWNLNTAYSESYFLGAQHKDFANRVEELSDGRMKVEIFYSGSLGYAGADVMAALKSGLVDVTEISVITAAEEVARWWAWSSFVSIAESYEQVKYIEERIFALQRADIEAYGGVKTISLHNSDPAECMEGFWSKTPIESLADLQGKVIRVYYPMALKHQINAIGANGIYISGAEGYHALKTGLCDMWFQTTTAGVANHYYEVAPYFYAWEPIAFCTWGIAAGLTSFDALPADLQQVVVEAGDDHSKFMMEELVPNQKDYLTGDKLGGSYSDKTSVEYLQKQPGVELYRLDALHEIMADLGRKGLDAWVEETQYPQAILAAQWLYEAIEKYPGITNSTYLSLEPGVWRD